MQRAKIPGTGPARAKPVRPGYTLANTGAIRRQSTQDRRTDLLALREQIKKLAAKVGPNKHVTNQAKLQSVLDQLKSKYGNAEYHKAVVELNYTYKGADKTTIPTNVNKGIGPVQ
jgi:hypothetical protein